MAEPPGVAPASGQLRFERAGVRILSSAHGPGVDEVPEWQAFHRWLLEETARLTNVGGWSYDLTTGAVYWTAQTARIHDIEPGAVVDAEGALRHFTPESKAWLESAISAAAAYAEPFDLELDLVSEAGRLKRVRVLGHVAVDDGRAVRVYGSVQDVTEARRAERELSDAHLSRHGRRYDAVPDVHLRCHRVGGEGQRGTL